MVNNVISSSLVGSNWNVASVDMVMPDGNEQFLVDMASRLRIKNLIFLVSNIGYKLPKLVLNGVVVHTALVLSNPNDFSRAKKLFNYVVGPAERKYFDLKVDFILGAEYSLRKDSVHYRSTMLNQVHAKLCVENGATIIFDFGGLLNVSDTAIVLGRMQQNSVLVKKYGLKFAVFSIARNAFEMRSRYMLNSLAKTLKL